MRSFDDVASYLLALRADPSLAVISLQMAADALEVSRAVIERRIKEGILEVVTIDELRSVRASSVLAMLDADLERIEAVEHYLETVAATGKTTPYTPVMERIGMKTQVPHDRLVIGRILGQISRRTQTRDGFMLSALVVKANTGRPSSAFFDLARELELDVDDEAAFLDDQLKLIWSRYAKKKNVRR